MYSTFCARQPLVTICFDLYGEKNSSEILQNILFCVPQYKENEILGGNFFKGNDGSKWRKTAQEQGFPCDMLQKRAARWVSLTLTLQKRSPSTAWSVPLQHVRKKLHVCVCVHMRETHDRCLTCKKKRVISKINKNN